ncbi:SDR family oxidoreductase [Arthrobacter oryzae]|uniref:SDR family oxidoreductase n=1 Tax=Arthrobacter oryzae TaxID=409290 RepID=UPI0037C0C4E9
MGRILPRERPLRPPGTRRRPSDHGPAEWRCRARANLALVDIDDAANEETERLVKEGEGRASYAAGKRHPGKRRRLRAGPHPYGNLDIAFNNVGKDHKVAPLADKKWAHIWQRNVTSSFLCLRNQIPIMLQAGGGISGAGVIGIKGTAACATANTPS